MPCRDVNRAAAATGCSAPHAYKPRTSPRLQPRRLCTQDQQRLAACLRQIMQLRSVQLPAELGNSFSNLTELIYNATTAQRQGIIQCITDHAITAAKSDKKAAASAWKLNAHTMMDKGAAAAHRHIKMPRGMEQHIQSNGLPQVGQQAVQALVQTWRPLWQAPSKPGTLHHHTTTPPHTSAGI